MLRWQLRERVAVPPLAGRLGAAGCRTDSGVAFPATKAEQEDRAGCGLALYGFVAIQSDE